MAAAHAAKLRAGERVEPVQDDHYEGATYGASSAEDAIDVRKKEAAQHASRDGRTLRYIEGVLGGAGGGASAAACGDGCGACTARATVIMETYGALPVPLCCEHDREQHRHFPQTPRFALERLAARPGATPLLARGAARVLLKLRPGEILESPPSGDLLRDVPLQVPCVPCAPCGVCGSWACTPANVEAGDDTLKPVSVASPAGVYSARFVPLVVCITCETVRAPDDSVPYAASQAAQSRVIEAFALRNSLRRRCRAAELEAVELRARRAARRRRGTEQPGLRCSNCGRSGRAAPALEAF